MGWTDNREQGLTGRKRPCAPRSSQLQTSITMIIYPVLTKCTVSMFHQRPVNRHCIGKFMGTGSQGQVGKRGSHWWLLSKGRKKQRKEKSVFCTAERTIYYRAFAEDSICCPAACFFFFFFLCCLSEWEMEVYEPSPGYRGPSAMVLSNFLVLSRPWVQTRRIRCETLVSPFNLPGVVKTTCLYACLLKIRIW